MRPLLADPDFRRFWVGQTISAVGSRISREGLPLAAVLVLGASPAAVGLLGAAESAAVLLVALVAGVWVDRLRRRPILIGADLGRALVLASIPLAAAAGVLGFGQLVAAAFAAALLGAFFDVAYAAYLPALVGPERLVEGNARVAQSDALGEVAGPSLGGALIALLGAPLAIAADAASFAVSAVSLALIRRPEPAPLHAAHRAGLVAEARAGIAIVWREPRLRALAGTSGLLALFGSFYTSLYVIYAIRTLGFGPALLGVVISLGGVGSLVGGGLASRAVRRLGLGRAAVVAALVSALLGLLVPLAAWVPFGAALACLALPQLVGDAARTIHAIGESSIRQRLVPREALGRATATSHVLAQGVGPLGALAGGLLAEWLGIPAAVAIAGLGQLGAAALLARSAVRELA